MQRMPKHFLRRIAICGKKDYNIDGMRQAAAERRQTTDEKQKMQMLLGHCNCRAGGPAAHGKRGRFNETFIICPHFVFKSVIGRSKPGGILKSRKAAEAVSRSLSVRRPLFSTSLLSNPFCKKSPLHTAAGISSFQVSLFPGPVEWNTPPASRRGRGAEETLQGKSVFMICFQFCDASFKSTGYSIIRKVAEAVSRTFRSADPSFLPLFFLTPFAPSAPLIFSGALNFFA